MNRRTFLLNTTAMGFALAAQPLQAAATLPPISTNTYPWGTFAKREGKSFALHTDAALAAIASTGITGYEPIINSPAEFDGLGTRLKQHGLEMPSLYVNSSLHDEPWLDFTSAQSSHGDLVESWRFVEKHWARQPIKPVMDLESSYPDALIPAAWLPESLRAAHRSTQPSNDDHARRAAYWAVFAGAAGHTYGHNSIWQMYAPPRKPILSPPLTWEEALDAPSARQMGYLRGLIESRPFLSHAPDQALIAGHVGEGVDHMRALRGDGYALIYTPVGKPFRVHLDRLTGREVRAWWFDPRTGQVRPAGQFAKKGSREFVPPGTPGVGNDWVLVLDNPARGLGPPRVALPFNAPTTPADSPTPAAVWLDALPHGFIANPYGPPQRRLSFGKTPLRIAGRAFEHGLGTHAPARLELNLDRRASRFTAFVGVDQGASYRTNLAAWDRKKGAAPYVYDGNDDILDKAQGATVRFRVLADERELFDSGPLTESSEPRPISLPLTGVNRLLLLAEPGTDGSFADHANWADAKVELAAGASADGLLLSAPAAGIIVNHVGFHPANAKLFLMDDDQPREFAVVSTRTGQPVFNRRTTRRSGDWGVMFEGDFSLLREPGTYSIRCAHQTSEPFTIRADLDQHLLAKHLNWFLMQRCGDPRNGWERGQHADDGRRRDDGRHQDVSGGWHDAADLRKWCMNVTGLWGLSEWATTLEGWLRPRVLDEIRWGNKYFFAMQEAAGYLMSHVGGDVDRHGDNNRFTDNQPGTEDDRIIVTEPAAPEIQFVFIVSEVNAARAFAKDDAAYAQRCREAAARAYAWMSPRLNTNDAYAVGGALMSASRAQPATRRSSRKT